MNRTLGAIGIVLIILSSIAMAEEDVPIIFTIGDDGKFTAKNIGTDPIYVLDKVSIVDNGKNTVHTIQDFSDTTVLKIYPKKSYSWESNGEISEGDYKGKIYWGNDKNVLTATYTEEFTVEEDDEKIIIPAIPRPTFTMPRPTFTIPRPTFTIPRPTFTIPRPTPAIPIPSRIAHVKFYTDKNIYNRGEEVELTMKNIGTIPIYVHVPNQLEDPWIVKKIGLGEIIHINTGCEYGYGLSCDHITLEPGEEVSYLWSQKDDNGVQVSPGTYKAYARYTKDNPDTVANPNMVTRTTTFLIRR